ncbi:uncharacterized protein [Miscanthus floridulus]|uniref:uncharacterized protein isoform X4 n=1 Tax=Miscanthus floridulus TaxID=154761 RepID=UPI00345AC945
MLAVISVRHRTSFHRPILRTIIRFLRMIFILVQEYCFETTSFHGCILRAISRKEDEGKEDKSMQSMGRPCADETPGGAKDFSIFQIVLQPTTLTRIEAGNFISSAKHQSNLRS